MAALADLPDLTVRISAALGGAGVPHAVSGALAMAAHGFVGADYFSDRIRSSKYLTSRGRSRSNPPISFAGRGST